MNTSFRQSMAWLHTWSGLLVGWILFAIFLTGTVAFFNDEITVWMQPELKSFRSSEQALGHAVRFLEQKAPEARRWNISLPSKRGEGVNISWQPEQKDGEEPRRRRGDRSTSATLDDTGQAVNVRDTRGGNFLYRFHFNLHYMPVIWARWVVGFCTMFMLVAIVTGIVTHKKIFTDFFTLRLKKGQRSWLDGHNVTAVLALPFHLMITYTGLVTLMSLYMPWGIAANYKNTDSFYETVFPRGEETKRSGVSAPLVPLDDIVEKATALWGGKAPSNISITYPGDSAATVDITRSVIGELSSRRESLTFHGITGDLMPKKNSSGVGIETRNIMINVHAGRYSGTTLRWLYFLSGVAGTIMIGTGLVLWTVKRRQKLPDPARPHFGFRLIEKLNVGTIVGLPAGVAAYFLANRLLPVDMAERPIAEIDSMFVVWAGVFIWAMLRSTKRAWIEGFVAAAILYTAVPIVNSVTTDRGLLNSLLNHDWLFASFDITMILTAGCFFFLARKVQNHTPLAKPDRTKRNRPSSPTPNAGAAHIEPSDIAGVTVQAAALDTSK